MNERTTQERYEEWILKGKSPKWVTQGWFGERPHLLDADFDEPSPVYRAQLAQCGCGVAAKPGS